MAYFQAFLPPLTRRKAAVTLTPPQPVALPAWLRRPGKDTRLKFKGRALSPNSAENPDCEVLAVAPEKVSQKPLL